MAFKFKLIIELVTQCEFEHRMLLALIIAYLNQCEIELIKKLALIITSDSALDLIPNTVQNKCYICESVWVWKHNLVHICITLDEDDKNFQRV